MDADPRVVCSTYPGLGIHADAAAAMIALRAHLTARVPDFQPESPGAPIASDLRRHVETRLMTEGFASELNLLRDLRDSLPSETDTFWDMTIAGYWAWSAWDPQDGEFHSAQAAGGLGYAFPAALAAALATGRRTFAVSGDGGAMYSIAELAAARQHQANVTWLIIDDGGYGILREYMVRSFGEVSAADLVRPDFVALAKAFGVDAWTADLGNVGAVIREASVTSGPAVVVLAAELRMFNVT